MFENPSRGRQARNFTTNVPKILDLKSSSEQIFFENWRWVPLTRVSLGSLSNNVFERRTLTGSGLFSFFDGSFAQIFSQIASITVKKLRNTNFISPRHVKRENTSLPVDVRRSKTLLLKLPILAGKRGSCRRSTTRFSVNVVVMDTSY